MCTVACEVTEEGQQAEKKGKMAQGDGAMW